MIIIWQIITYLNGSENEIAAFWFWLIMSHTVPEKLKLNNESEFNSALKG